MSALNLDIPEKYQPYLRLGTCSWKYEGWKGLIYREDVRYAADDYLADYARYFNSVEVDQWFWSLFPAGVKLPDPRVAKTYAESVPDDFVFTVKAPNAITLTNHYAKQAKGHADFANKPNPDFLSLDLLNRFLDTLSPMGKKLDPIMFQFEYLNKTKMPSLKAFLEGSRQMVERRVRSAKRPDHEQRAKDQGDQGDAFPQQWGLDPTDRADGRRHRRHGPDDERGSQVQLQVAPGREVQRHREQAGQPAGWRRDAYGSFLADSRKNLTAGEQRPVASAGQAFVECGDRAQDRDPPHRELVRSPPPNQEQNPYRHDHQPNVGIDPFGRCVHGQRHGDERAHQRTRS